MSGNTYDFSIADTIRSVKSPDNDFAFTDGYNKLKKIDMVESLKSVE